MLSICGKVFERLIFNEMFRFFILLNQISLFPNLEIHVSTNYYQVPTKVDEVSKARGVFLDISKAFDKV